MFQSKVHIQDEHSTPKPKSEVNNKFEVNGINSNGTNTPNGLTNGLTLKENGVEIVLDYGRELYKDIYLNEDVIELL